MSYSPVSFTDLFLTLLHSSKCSSSKLKHEELLDLEEESEVTDAEAESCDEEVLTSITNEEAAWSCRRFAAAAVQLLLLQFARTVWPLKTAKCVAHS